MLHIPSAQKTLSLAVAIEDHHIRCFREWALRFRTFDPVIRLALEHQVRDMEGQRSELLYHASRRLGIHEKLSRPVVASIPRYSEHFFIFSEQVALAILRAAVRLKEVGLGFYRRGYRNAPLGSRLGQLYKNFASFKEVHIEILLEAIARLEQPVPLTRIG